MRCENCGVEVEEKEVFQHREQNLCEDCYVEALSVPKTCDPMAVRSARLTREMQGQSEEDGLLPLQQEIYDYIKAQGKVKRPDIAQHFELTYKELEKHFAILRHCELVKGQKEGNDVYLVPFK